MKPLDFEFILSSGRCNNDNQFIFNICHSNIHGNAEGPLVNTNQLFVSQARIGQISRQFFDLFPKF